jgi:hypothetical protein
MTSTDTRQRLSLIYFEGVNHMNKLKETFFKSMDYFKNIRIKTLEVLYDQTMRTRDNQSQYETIHERLLELIGEDNRQLLIEYTDLLVAKYNTDPAWFYDKGFQDCQSTYGVFRAILTGVEAIPPLQEEKGTAEQSEELFELINT